jgi:hypothetical protein
LLRDRVMPVAMQLFPDSPQRGLEPIPTRHAL